MGGCPIGGCPIGPGCPALAKGAPQLEQNRASSVFGRPHRAHCMVGITPLCLPW
jgi:hypothetical protein